MMLAHDHHLLLRTCDNRKYYSFFYNLHPMQNTTPCNAGQASRGRLRIQIGIWNYSQMRGMGQSKHILMPAANWDLTLTPGWQNENRELMRGNWNSNGVTDNSNSSYNQCFLLFSSCAICNFVLWKSFCFVYDAGNWSQMPPIWVYTMLDFTFLLRQIIFLTSVIRISALAN